MQPEPTTAPTSNTKTHIPENDHSRKHGLRAHEPPVPVSPAIVDGGAGRSLSPEEQLALDEAFARSLQESADQPRPFNRLSPSPRSTPSPPPVNRVSEYEQASTPPVRRREGPGFEVIKKQRSPNDKRSPIQELPNEVLTHALAHLSPTDLISVASVSKRFHDLVTGPHAWRSAFSHFFPGADTLDATLLDADEDAQDVRSEKRAFTRLTALASWRSEYIMRTRLLRSLARGKPVQATASANSSSRSGQSHTAKPFVEYNAQLFTTINHLHATFGTGLNIKPPRLIHGADDVGIATSSDPVAGKVDNWGLSDPQQFLQFAERFPGDAQYGLGPGDVVGVPNVMDVSHPYGMIHGEGSPGGMVYYRSTDEMRGRFLQLSSAMAILELGIPRISSTNEAFSAVWIAKSNTIPSLTEGVVGMLSGSSLGVLTAYSLGATSNGNTREQRFGRGEVTARWVLSPGVPLIAIAVDPEHSLTRQAQNRIWAVVLNALGEVYYLTKFPKRPHAERGSRQDGEVLERTAWLTGRSVHWNTVESSRRSARPDPYAQTGVDGSYSPRPSWNGMCLSKEQIKAETREMGDFAARKPKDFQKVCVGWDMRRKLEVDFAGDDGHNAGESVVVIDCGLDEDSVAGIKRYTRCRYQDHRTTTNIISTPPLTDASTDSSSPPSLFGSPSHAVTASIPGFSLDRLDDALAQDDTSGSITPRPLSEDWRVTDYTSGGLKHVEILATALDGSTFATRTISEDPLLSFSGRSSASSPSLTPLSVSGPVLEPADMPGQRARLFAVGTKTGIVLLWNMRAPPPKNGTACSSVGPVRTIYTESPQISCLALSSLFVIHGGNDGLVQAWDPLGSSLQPIRTLSSRFASRARRQLAQAQASPQGVGINLFAAGALCLDPDPTVLRGMVSLGVRLLYWSYSSSAADQYKSQKRRLRRTERGSNNGGAQFSGAARGNLKDYIANEKFELDRDKRHRRKEAQRFAGRFGTELMGGSEEEMLAYAAMLSQDTLEQESLRRSSDTSIAVGTDHSVLASGNTASSGSLSPPVQASPKSDEELDADVAEAIRQSLASSPTAGAYDIPIRQAKRKGRKGSSARPSPKVSPNLAGSSKASEMSDLEFAMQLSLAEEQSKQAEVDGFPALASDASVNGRGNGKGKRRQS
ncbi:hypothetical protein LTR91_006182 [Friedmanniomyces endolithicus]|uniref:F-box domain-containing protein n=1 Tax=Friedmanniomyces endolithicus TaxID=329885 RepID=A0AAN6FBC2_9PEZI|nr:hypothetical protein LTR35_012796 [Friedmanniomyces endolithicus]KAK0297424.1 hypothetical protein LTS00_004147 [Friedmanniomyces endolithicus]KAK0311053.1 hypothetical protein LTR82_014503 [Friedmanniomyces endolithicus]KAK0924390.1 hypothetical protein LTR57_005909 [Friedmanniomyces endolithicus]KAK0989018.1 hypothetical protein LTR54_012594 [Friedmanniomyces endolithicus]